MIRFALSLFLLLATVPAGAQTCAPPVPSQVRPVDCGAAGDGVAADDAPFVSMTAYAAQNGSSILIDRRYKLTTTWAVEHQRPRIDFTEDGLLIAGTSSNWVVTSAGPDEPRAPLLRIGHVPSEPTGLSITTAMVEGDDQLSLNDASAVPVGSTIQFRWSDGTQSWGAGFSALVVAKAGNVLTISPPAPDTIPAGALTWVGVDPDPIRDPRITGFRAVQDHVRTGLSALELSHVIGAQVSGLRTEGFDNALTGLTVLHSRIEDADSLRDGAWAVWSLYGFTGVDFDRAHAREAQNFGVNFRFGSDLYADGGYLGPNRPRAGRGMKFLNVRNAMVRDWTINGWAHTSFWSEGTCYGLTYDRVRALRPRTANDGTGAGGQGFVVGPYTRRVHISRGEFAGADVADFAVSTAGLPTKKVTVDRHTVIGDVSPGSVYTVID